MGRGSVYPPGRECKWLRGFMGSITGRILKNLRATISEGKDMNLLDLGSFQPQLHSTRFNYHYKLPRGLTVRILIYCYGFYAASSFC